MFTNAINFIYTIIIITRLISLPFYYKKSRKLIKLKKAWLTEYIETNRNLTTKEKADIKKAYLFARIASEEVYVIKGICRTDEYPGGEQMLHIDGFNFWSFPSWVTYIELGGNN